MTIAIKHITTIKNKYLIEVITQYAKKEYNEENLQFYYSKLGNEALYNQFVKIGSPDYVNLPDKLRTPLDTKAAAKKWSAMTADMTKAKSSIAGVIQTNTVDRLGNTPEGQLALCVVEMALDGGKAIQMAGLLAKHLTATGADRQTNYLAMQKLVSKAKLDAALVKWGHPATPPRPVTPAPVAPPKPVVAPPKPPTPAPNADTIKAIAQMKEDIIDGTAFLKSAINSVKTKGKPDDKEEVTRMFESGSMRHNKVHDLFTERLQKDKAFNPKSQAAFFKQKDDFSKLWATYRKLLS